MTSIVTQRFGFAVRVTGKTAGALTLVILCALLLSGLIAGTAFAREATEAGATEAADPATACGNAIRAAESLSPVPDHLLQAIALTESGRHDAASNSRTPWPWTINAAGKGRYFDTKDAAMAHVRSLLKQGVYSIDVGCMQVNLLYHATAFDSLEEAFDPVTNVAYATSFLLRLKDRHRSWTQAVKHYHSATTRHNGPYFRKVNREWAALKQGRPDKARADMTARKQQEGHGGAIPAPGALARTDRNPAVAANQPLGKGYLAQRQAEWAARARVMAPVSGN